MVNKLSRPVGRPREFDRDKALDRAVTTFWAKGYNGTSLDDLTQNMGITRPSLYAAFGNKHKLFLEVIDRYETTLACQPMSAFHDEADVEKAVTVFFEECIRCVTKKGGPKGCLLASVATETAEKDLQVRKRVGKIFAGTDKFLTDHFRVAQDFGHLSPAFDPQALARMILSLTHSFSTRARAGSSRTELLRLAKEFMEVLFPSNREQ